MTENQKKIADLEELCKPVIEYLKENSDPYVEITITSEHIKVKRDIMSIPVAATECEEMKILVVDEQSQGYTKEFTDIKRLKDAVIQLLDNNVYEIKIKRKAVLDGNSINSQNT